MENLTSWVDIDLDVLSNNIKIIKKYIGKTRMLAVVKADAYGHGIVPVALTAQDVGVDFLGITSVDEGILLRKNGINLPILVFNTILPEQAEKVLKYDLTASVCSFDVVQALNEAAKISNKKIRVHIKVDTGFGRFGLLPEYVPEFVKVISSNFKNIYIEGIYTHFSMATSEKITRKQFEKFESTINQLKAWNFNIPIRHVCNSIATIKYPEMHLDMVRVGNLMYGLCPAGHLEIEKPAGVFSRIIFINNLPKGHNVGYGNRYRTRRPTTVAVVPFGYYDGLELMVSQPNGILDGFKSFLKQVLAYFGITGQARKVKIKGKLFNIIGKIGMQNCMVDITDSKDDIFVGDRVELFLRKVNLSYSLPRVYHKQDELYVDLRQPAVNNDVKNEDFYKKGSEQSIG